MRIIGCDPGYDRLGVAVIEKEGNTETLLHSACLTSDRSHPFEVRIYHLGEQIEKLFTQYQPRFFALEKLFFNKNNKTALAVAEMIGILRYISQKNNVSVQEFTPPQIKVALTGNGRAHKDEVMRMVSLLVQLPHVSGKRLDDEFDAIAVALTAAATLRY